MPAIPNPFDDRRERLRAKAAVTYAFLTAINVAAWAWAWLAFADRPALLGTAFLAYTFGLRHAFDADHIAAIDNVIRKLTQQGRAPYSAGFFFALGHSTIVIIAAALFAVATTALQSRLEAFHGIGGVIGTSVSALFLLIIGLTNLAACKGIWSAFLRARRGGRVADEDLDLLLSGRGLLARLLRPVFRLVARSWHMYPVGFLFGLGFDTATEIGLLGIAATQAAQHMAFWQILVFPALFTAGMSLMDTTDSVLMTGAYGWAFLDPLRKLTYNLVITAASVVIAMFIGGLEALNLIGDRLGMQGRFWELVGSATDSFASFGYIVAGTLVAAWIVSGLVHRARAG